MRIECHICNRGPNECHGWLERVNPKGEKGTWECRPGCEAPPLSQEEAVLGALGHEEDQS